MEQLIMEMYDIRPFDWSSKMYKASIKIENAF
jgi:hypothetical protein